MTRMAIWSVAVAALLLLGPSLAQGAGGGGGGGSKDQVHTEIKDRIDMLLDKVRATSKQNYAGMRKKVLDKFSSKFNSKTKDPAAAKRAVAEIGKVLDQAHDESDARYKTDKKNLVQKVMQNILLAMGRSSKTGKTRK